MSHIQHPRIVEHGLVDGCPRCAEIAADPFVGLDPDNLRELVRRTRTRAWMRDTAFPRSETEAVAMRVMEQTLVRMRHIERLEQKDAFRCEPDPSCGQSDGEPSDDEIYNRAGVEGGIAYPLDDAPGSLGEHDWRL